MIQGAKKEQERVVNPQTSQTTIPPHTQLALKSLSNTVYEEENNSYTTAFSSFANCAVDKLQAVSLRKVRKHLRVCIIFSFSLHFVYIRFWCRFHRRRVFNFPRGGGEEFAATFCLHTALLQFLFLTSLPPIVHPRLPLPSRVETLLPNSFTNRPASSVPFFSSREKRQTRHHSCQFTSNIFVQKLFIFF